MKQLLLLPLTIFMLFAQEYPFELFKKGDSKSGYTLMVFGGIHGNEPGGFFAPAILAQYYTITKGALWVTPDINQKSITRYHRGLNGDMNRKFDTIEKDDKDFETVEAIKKLINNPDVDLILNLHDGHGFYRKKYKNGSFNPGAWGQSCVIDQICIEDTNTTFAKLNDVAQKVSELLNKGLLEDHHIFHVKNTKTRFKNRAMQQSLTYYAIKHNKPAFAIETSKNITDLGDKVLYQLRALEAFMQIMGIEFTRSFELNKEGIDTILKEYGTVRINDNISFNLQDIKGILRYVPMKKTNNTIKFSHPLADVIKKQKYYELYVGHKRIVSLFPQIFEMKCDLTHINMMIDGEKRRVEMASTIDIKASFRLEAPKGYRVNIIGYTNKSHSNENNITLTYNDMIPLYAIDRSKQQFRAEIYHENSFCGMIVLNFLPQD